MTRAEGFLTDTEKQALEVGEAYQRARTIRHVGELGVALDQLPGTIDRIRASGDEQLVRQIGKKAHRLTALLTQLDPILNTQPEPVVPEIAVPDSEQQVVSPAREVRLENDAVISTSPEELSTREDWLVKGIGPDWRERLSLALDADSTTIAQRLVELAPPRRPNTPERCIIRIVGYLDGLTLDEIASRVEGDTPRAAYQYLHTLPSRVRTPSAEPAQQRSVSAETIVRTPEQHGDVDEGRRLLRKVARRTEGLHDEISSDEWRQLAETQLRVHAEAKGLSAEEVDRLWTRLHYDEAAAYAEPADDAVTEVLNKLQFMFVSQRTTGGYTPKERLALRTLLDTSRGVCTLDDVHHQLGLEFNTSKTLTQYNLVAGVVQLLHES